jgi:leucyl/phenylalanyl-tRNA--protein transferase
MSASMVSQQTSIPWLDDSTPLPSAHRAFTGDSPLRGLVAAGGGLSVRRLLEAYSHGIFPWFSQGQPVLWWSTDPRMTLRVQEFKLHRSLKKTIHQLILHPRMEVRIDSAFEQVILGCATSPRQGQTGTWILPEMVSAYTELHRAGYAHSVETWIEGQLVGGLYCVAIGHAVFGESMFTRHTDASKIALAALVAFARAKHIDWIDCQQNTRHLASLGAKEVKRSEFLNWVEQDRVKTPPEWHFEPHFWQHLISWKEPT